MGTGIFTPWGDEVKQESIDTWCGLCRYPSEGTKCKDKASIRACFRLPNANAWHLLHECPMAHGGEECRCNALAQLKKTAQNQNPDR